MHSTPVSPGRDAHVDVDVDDVGSAVVDVWIPPSVPDAGGNVVLVEFRVVDVDVRVVVVLLVEEVRLLDLPVDGALLVTGAPTVTVGIFPVVPDVLTVRAVVLDVRLVVVVLRLVSAIAAVCCGSGNGAGAATTLPLTNTSAAATTNEGRMCRELDEEEGRGESLACLPFDGVPVTERRSRERHASRTGVDRVRSRSLTRIEKVKGHGTSVNKHCRRRGSVGGARTRVPEESVGVHM